MQAFVNGRTITDEPRTSRGPFMFIPRRHVIGLPFAFLWSSKAGASASIFSSSSKYFPFFQFSLPVAFFFFSLYLPNDTAKAANGGGGLMDFNIRKLENLIH
jgi:hypothetical protein